MATHEPRPKRGSPVAARGTERDLRRYGERTGVDVSIVTVASSPGSRTASGKPAQRSSDIDGLGRYPREGRHRRRGIARENNVQDHDERAAPIPQKTRSTHQACEAPDAESALEETGHGGPGWNVRGDLSRTRS